MLVTQDTEIEVLLGRLTDEGQHNSNDSLVGLYVYGSLVTGDFDKDRSDIDLLAVVSPGEPFHLKALGKDWLINWYMVREVGVTSCGPPPSAMIPEIIASRITGTVESASDASW